LNELKKSLCHDLYVIKRLLFRTFLPVAIALVLIGIGDIPCNQNVVVIGQEFEPSKVVCGSVAHFDRQLLNLSSYSVTASFDPFCACTIAPPNHLILKPFSLTKIPIQVYTKGMPDGRYTKGVGIDFRSGHREWATSISFRLRVVSR
jgi:hypothetical protein